MIRVAAVGDLHVAVDSARTLAPQWTGLADDADVLLLAGDLTRLGLPEEADVLARELANVGVPVVGVLGNHDHHHDCPDEVVTAMVGAGVRMLEGDAVTIDIAGHSLGIAGVKGFGFGFPGASAGDFGEPEMKAFAAHARDAGRRLDEALATLDTDLTVALTHYSPVEDTLEGERREIWPFLGSYFLAEAVDAHRVDLVVHGHAHAGVEKGMTPGGVPVRNVAHPVIRQAYRVYCLEPKS